MARHVRSDGPGPRRALLLMENETFPQDPRMRQQAESLVARGWDVDVVCPRGQHMDTEPFEKLPGITVRRVAIPQDQDNLVGFIKEYVTALVGIGFASANLMRKGRYDVVLFANSPDFLLLTALLHRVRGSAIVFDHKDLCPELVLAKGFPEGGLVHKLMLRAERFSFGAAHVVLTVNESYKRLAVLRGGCNPDTVRVVRCAPDMERFAVPDNVPVPAPVLNHQYVLGYLGVVGAHDGVDDVVRVVQELNLRGYDTGAVVVGDGSYLDQMKQLARELGVFDNIAFLGKWPGDRVGEPLAFVDVCLVPDPPTAFNLQTTLAKTVEYLAMGKPTVAYDLPETRVSGGDVVQFASGHGVAHLTDAVGKLLEDPALRSELGKRGKQRAETAFTWDHFEPIFLDAFAQAMAIAKGNSRVRRKGITRRTRVEKLGSQAAASPAEVRTKTRVVAERLANAAANAVLL